MFIKLRKLLLIIAAIYSLLLIIKYLINNKKIKLLNQIYFEIPILLKSNKICPNYQNLLENSLNSSFSASIINDKGEIIASYNSDKLRIPASNLKLFSTAYTLSKYNASDKLTTSLLKDNLNNFYLIGSGDPDLSLSDIKKLLDKIKFSKSFNFYILEINNKNKWPEGWTTQDRLYSYGSPITSLAIKSNENKYIDILFINEFINNYFKNKYPLSSYKISKLEYNKNIVKNLKTVNQIYSNPILSLVTLANAESHNFTAESLYKNSSNSWNTNNYLKLKKWLKVKGLPVREIYINDASGLSRDNRITTNLTALFLYKMRYSKQFEFFNSSLSLMGERGTLSNRKKNTELSGRFFGKTGTLSNVFALSGYLYKDNDMLSLSVIQNSRNIDTYKTFELIHNIYKLEKC